MFKLIDDFLNSITMYRLVLYFLIVLAGVGLFFSVTKVLPFDPVSYVLSFGLIILVSWITNIIFSEVFDAPTNIESWWISALILGLIITPAKNIQEIIVIAWAAVLAMSLKYIFAIGKKHIFNPVAISVFLTATFIKGGATWWVGSSSMLAIVAIGGFLVVRKIRRWDLVLSFLGTALVTIFISGILKGTDPFKLVSRSISDTPLLFFASIMITEPLTTPPTRELRIIYGSLVGFLFAPQIHLGSLFTTPEIALIIGNIFAYIVSPKLKLILSLKSKVQLAPDIIDFVFVLPKPIKFTPGQYMEFTLPHASADSRGNRRYLSLASSPTETEVRLGVKFANPSSSFKKSLFNLSQGQKLTAGQLIGDFTLPKDQTKKLAFIAGGIGITPYRSILKYLIDTRARRDVVLIYLVSHDDEFVYTDVLEEARRQIGLKIFYIDSATKGRVDSAKLRGLVPDAGERTFYISGSNNVVKTFEKMLSEIQIPKNHIVKDYFPGFA